MEAPAELWERVAGGPAVKARPIIGRPMAWAMAAVLLIALAVVLAVRAHAPVAVAGGEAAARSLQFESGDPAADSRLGQRPYGDRRSSARRAATLRAPIGGERGRGPGTLGASGVSGRGSGGQLVGCESTSCEGFRYRRNPACRLAHRAVSRGSSLLGDERTGIHAGVFRAGGRPGSESGGRTNGVSSVPRVKNYESAGTPFS